MARRKKQQRKRRDHTGKVAASATFAGIAGVSHGRAFARDMLKYRGQYVRKKGKYFRGQQAGQRAASREFRRKADDVWRKYADVVDLSTTTEAQLRKFDDRNMDIANKFGARARKYGRRAVRAEGVAQTYKKLSKIAGGYGGIPAAKKSYWPSRKTLRYNKNIVGSTQKFFDRLETSAYKGATRRGRTLRRIGKFIF